MAALVSSTEERVIYTYTGKHSRSKDDRMSSWSYERRSLDIIIASSTPHDTTGGRYVGPLSWPGSMGDAEMYYAPGD